MSDHSGYYPGMLKGYGVIHENPRKVYEWCRKTDQSLLVVRSGVSFDKTMYLDRIFGEIDNAMTEMKLMKEFVTNPYDALLYFLKVHKRYFTIFNQTGFKNEADREKRFWPSDVICIEVSSYLPAHMEYIITMYMYLYHREVLMPQLYVIVDYPTDDFSFISTDIFNLPEPQPIGEYSSEVAFSEMTGSLVLPKYGEQLTRGSVHVIISSNGLYEKLKQHLIGKQHHVFEDIVSFLKTDSSSDVPSVILVNTVEDLLYWKERFVVEKTEQKREFRLDMIVVDMVVKVPKNTMYTGNHMMPMLPNMAYRRSIVKKLEALKAEVGSAVKIEVFYEDVQRPVVVRGIFEISPINDIVLFLKYGIRFSLLYANYQSPGSARSFISVIRQETDMLSELNIDKKLLLSGEKDSPDAKWLDQKEVVIRYGIHPIFVSIIQKWFERGWPRFSVLIFVAVMTTSSGKVVEIREPGTREYDNDISQTSRYGQIFYEFLRLCASTGDPYPNEANRTSKLLLKLSEIYGTLGEEYLPNHNEYHRHLVRLLSEDFKPYILHRLSHSKYRGAHSAQRNWSISQTAQAPEYLFPLSVVISKTSMYVPLFVPVDRIAEGTTF